MRRSIILLLIAGEHAVFVSELATASSTDPFLGFPWVSWFFLGLSFLAFFSCFFSTFSYLRFLLASCFMLLLLMFSSLLAFSNSTTVLLMLHTLTLWWIAFFNMSHSSIASPLPFHDDLLLFFFGLDFLGLFDLKSSCASRSPGWKFFRLLFYSNSRSLWVFLFLSLVPLGAGNALIFIGFSELVEADSSRARDRDSCSIFQSNWSDWPWTLKDASCVRSQGTWKRKCQGG